MLLRRKNNRVSSFALKKSVLATSGFLLTTLGALNVHAQENDTEETALEEIVVTGTLIRGIEPTGSQVIGIDRQAIVESGALSANELLGSLPQVSNYFNSRTDVDPRGASRITVSRPNLRSLPGINTSTGSATLTLVDGHRVAPIGVRQSATDPDVVPPGVMQRVEIITDGGSSLYGADAVGGVINFITRDKFDGVKVDFDYGTGEDFNTLSTNLTAGTSWDSGSAFASLNYSDRGELLNGDRDWAPEGKWTVEGRAPNGTECISPAGVLETWVWFGSWVQSKENFPDEPVGETCDIAASETLQPEQDLTSLLLGVTQELNDDVSLSVKSFYTERNTTFYSYARGDTISEPAPSEPGDFTFQRVQTASVGFSYAPYAGYDHRNQTTEFQTWGITPELTVDMDNGWQLRTTMHYSRSDTVTRNPSTNQAILFDAVEDGLVDPLNIGASDPDTLDAILDWESGGQAIQELASARMIADGAIMDLPTGQIRMAMGWEFMEQRAKQRLGDFNIGGLTSLDYNEASRNVKAAFAETQIPILDTLDMSVSVRHDDYTDFGSSTNPHIGFTYRPVDWAVLHLNWGESFNAPTVMDTLNAQFSTFEIFRNQGGVTPPPGVVIEDGRVDSVLISGAREGLKPQTADTWAAGFKISPPAVEGLTVSANYYEIEFYDILGSFNPISQMAPILYPDSFVFNPTQEDLDHYASLTVDGLDQLINIDPSTVKYIVDYRVNNTDQAVLKGVDFNINYQHETSFASMFYGLSGNHQTKYEILQGATWRDQLGNSAGYNLSGLIGFNRNNLNAKLTLKYSPSSDTDNAQLIALGQTSIDSFLVTDLFVGYNFIGSGLTDGLSLRLLVENLFDEEPPVVRRDDDPPYAGFTRGRVLKLGFSKTF